jgi:hypothetical protein
MIENPLIFILLVDGGNPDKIFQARDEPFPSKMPDIRRYGSRQR